jgi:hypothetical protein
MAWRLDTTSLHYYEWLNATAGYGELSFQFLTIPLIIVIEEGNKRRCRSFGAGITGSGSADRNMIVDYAYP